MFFLFNLIRHSGAGRNPAIKQIRQCRTKSTALLIIALDSGLRRNDG